MSETTTNNTTTVTETHNSIGANEERIDQKNCPVNHQENDATEAVREFCPFPVSDLPSVCAEFVDQAAHAIDCDPSMIALPLITGLASAIGNSCRIELKPGYTEPVTTWAAVVCESGSRKSPALEAPLGPIRQREAYQRKIFNAAL